jgi:hypothetical protein
VAAGRCQLFNNWVETLQHANSCDSIEILLQAIELSIEPRIHLFRRDSFGETHAEDGAARQQDGGF